MSLEKPEAPSPLNDDSLRDAWLNVLWHAPVGIAFVDRDLRLRRVNRAMAEIADRDADGFIGRPFAELRPIGETLQACLERTVREGVRLENVELEIDDARSEHHGRFFLTSFHPVWSSGDIVGACAFIDERSELRRHERERDAALERERAIAATRESEVAERAELERTLVGIVTHDLKSPISAILMTAELYLRQNRPLDEMRAGLRRIGVSAERATRMISDLLDFTQARLGGIRIHPATCELTAIVDSAVDEAQASYPGRLIYTSHEGRTAGTWDGDRLVQVVTNLVVNAVHYSAESSPIEVRTYRDDDTATIEVHNAGEPIPAHTLEVLFQPMQRGDHTSPRSLRSIGLGLFIVDRIVRSHHGSISVRSDVASGTTFTVELPRRWRG